MIIVVIVVVIIVLIIHTCNQIKEIKKYKEDEKLGFFQLFRCCNSCSMFCGCSSTNLRSPFIKSKRDWKDSNTDKCQNSTNKIIEKKKLRNKH